MCAQGRKRCRRRLGSAIVLCLVFTSTAFVTSLLFAPLQCSSTSSHHHSHRGLTVLQQQYHGAFATKIGSPSANLFQSSSSQEQEQVAETNEEKKKPKLSRSERKALERKKKQRKQQELQSSSRIRRNYQKKTATSSSKQEYSLHSNAISELTNESTMDDVLKAIKRAQHRHDHHDLRVIANFLLNEVDDEFAFGYRGSLLSRLAVAALHFDNHEVARQAIDLRRQEYRCSMVPMESAAIIRGLLRVHNISDAIELLQDELSLPLEGVPLDISESKDRLIHRARSLASIASRHFFEGEPHMAVKACQMLIELGPICRDAKLTTDEINIQWLRLIQGAAQCESERRKSGGYADSRVTSVTSGRAKGDAEGENVKLPCNLVYSVLSAMTTFPSDNDDRVFEAVANALVRRVLFVTGAVSMAGCPPADRGEAVFIGRSNVGKSSLVNMLTNRKSLAYTSKRPGKTQQFNFFTVNDKPGREKEIRYGDKVDGKRDLDSFYIVDLPGFGFAKVPEAQRQEWSEFMKEYLANRKTLKVVFHLVDGRHGPIDEDSNIMKHVGENLPKHVIYVVVLTKADKNVKNVNSKNRNLPLGKVSPDIIRSVRETMKANKVGNAPIIATSSTTKLGRDDIWRYLRLAAEA